MIDAQLRRDYDVVPHCKERLVWNVFLASVNMKTGR
jgi:hypothetical protein